ncbi:MAG: monofunctional biosynthetic peptidoglycan transglycosylase [Litorimonas sp.]
MTTHTNRLASLKRAIRYSVLGLAILFLAVHLMGLGHALLPVKGTWNMMLRPDGTDLRRDGVPIERISPHLINAVIAAEDSRFCQHVGIDFNAITDAMADNQSGGRRRGGSTITQQTAKNVFLWNGGGYARKAVEAWLTLYIDTVWTKRRIMEVYLNVAEWGDGIFGAEAAAQARFGKSASELTPREAALLAAVLPSPNKWRVNPPGSYVQGRARTLQQRASVVRNDGLASCVTG